MEYYQPLQASLVSSSFSQHCGWNRSHLIPKAVLYLCVSVAWIHSKILHFESELEPIWSIRTGTNLIHQNWNQSDPSELEPIWSRSVPRNPTELFGNWYRTVNLDLYQFCSSVSVLQKQPLRHAIHTGLIQICAYWSDTVMMLLQYWFSSENTPVTELFGNGTVLGQNIFGCVPNCRGGIPFSFTSALLWRGNKVFALVWRI